MAKPRRATNDPVVQPVAGNGLLDRRLLLRSGALFAGAMTTGVAGSIAKAAAEPLAVDSWSLTIGAPVTPYSLPSHFESKVTRAVGDTTRPGTQQARTPHQDLDEIITPNGVHFVVARAGAPDIDPDKHRLLIHGMVKQPLIFSLNDLMRYPMESHIRFIECGGNSAPMWSKTPIQANVQALHGLLSCSEWTGIRLSTLLDEAGVDPKATWMIAEGADGVTINRSIPIAKAMDDAMLVFFQNGERIHPWNGYPMRLFLPGYEGNMNVKWLRRLKLTDAPVMAINESRQYTLLLDSGKAWRFFYPQEVKSFITRPSPGMTMPSPGYYEITGIAYSGHGRIAKVEVSADGGKSWAMAALQSPVLPKALTRFRLPWQWSGQPATVMSRATDEAGNVQPTRQQLIAQRGEPRGTPPVAAFPMGHVNCICSWGIDARERLAMSMSRMIVAASAFVLAVTSALAADGPKFGKPISEADASTWDISIGPDGKGLPAGGGTPAQGAAIYAQKCASCHGAKGEGGIATRLFGGEGTLKTPAQPVQTVGSYWPYATMVFDFVRRAMPWDRPKSLTNDEVYATVAYILSINGLMKDGDVLDKDTIMKVQMPNRDGFIDLYPNKF